MGITEAFKWLGKKNDDAMMSNVAIEQPSTPLYGSTHSVDAIFSKAISIGASDIHIEPSETSVKIRFRVDGHFTDNESFPIAEHPGIVARIKILANLKIDEQRLPQDGKTSVRDSESGKDVDMRISTIPTICGEKVVIRLLKKESSLLDLRSIGMLPMNMVKINRHLESNFGLILVVGPTGSGKSTTLYSMISTFDSENQNISTLEDPVEYRIPGVNHTQINPQIGFSFADGLRSILRQDPDIIMVGEIRDSETAHLAVEASITGHLVFSTIHANSTVNTIQRLTNLGIDPLLVVSSLKLIVSQRLARKLCPHCKIAYTPEGIVRDKLMARIERYLNPDEELVLYKAHPNGCEKCRGKWHKGRTGFYEILEMTENLEKLILSKASKTQLEIQAIGDGMIPIKDDALIKAVLWEVSLEEIVSVLGGQ